LPAAPESKRPYRCRTTPAEANSASTFSSNRKSADYPVVNKLGASGKKPLTGCSAPTPGMTSALRQRLRLLESLTALKQAARSCLWPCLSGYESTSRLSLLSDQHLPDTGQFLPAAKAIFN